MKKTSNTSLKNGFILPSVLLLSTLVLLYVSSAISTYSKDMYMTRNIINQMKADTLFQMGYSQFKKEHIPPGETTDVFVYNFPDGEVTITFSLLDEVTRNLEIDIVTNTGHHFFVTKSLKTDFESHNTQMEADNKAEGFLNE